MGRPSIYQKIMGSNPAITYTFEQRYLIWQLQPRCSFSNDSFICKKRIILVLTVFKYIIMYEEIEFDIIIIKYFKIIKTIVGYILKYCFAMKNLFC